MTPYRGHVSAQLPTAAWVAPYLRLGERVRIGPLEVIAADSLSLDDWMSRTRSPRRGLIELYRRTPRLHEDFGCSFDAAVRGSANATASMT
jgi:hypothetical protein